MRLVGLLGRARTISLRYATIARNAAGKSTVLFHGMERNGTELVAEHGGRGSSYKRMIVAGFCGEARQLAGGISCISCLI